MKWDQNIPAKRSLVARKKKDVNEWVTQRAKTAVGEAA